MCPQSGSLPVLRLALGTNNVYALPGNGGVMLIDAGPDYEGAWEALLAALHAHAIAPADVRSVVLTHHHLDHAGLAARWQATGARILAARADAPALALDAAAREDERARIRREFFRHGIPPDALSSLPELSRPSAAGGIQPPPAGRDQPGAAGTGPARGAIGRARPRASSDAAGDSAQPRHAPIRTAAAAVLAPERYTRWPSPLRMTAVRPDLLLDDGACLDASGRILRVIAAPGHTPGTILLLEPATGALFTGDHILPRMAPSSGFQFDAGGRRRPSLPAYLASLRASRELADETRSFYPGHGDTAEDPADAVDWTVRLLEQRARRALAALRRGPGTAYDLALRMFPHLSPHHLRAAIAETVGLLDLLAERTLALAEETSDAVIWRATAQSPAPGMPDGTGGSLTNPEAHA